MEMASVTLTDPITNTKRGKATKDVTHTRQAPDSLRQVGKSISESINIKIMRIR